ncbi:unnamed protein product [Cochlearia groenlandica]
MAKIRADGPPRSSEVGEIDTRPPFQSVRAALGLFRQVNFSKQQPPRLSSQEASDKETHFLLAEQERDTVQLRLDGSVKAKAQVLSDLDVAQRKAADLKAKLEASKHSRKCAILTKQAMSQRLEQLRSENRETERVRENYVLVTAELFVAKQVLAEIKQQFSISVEERLAELQRAEEAEYTSMVNTRKIKYMSKEIVEMRDATEQLKSDASRKREEEEKINEESIDAKETYMAMKQEADQRLEDLRRGCDSELRKDIDELAKISAENECLREEINLARELKEAKYVLQELYEDENSHRNLASSLTAELLEVQRENTYLKQKVKDRQEVEETMREAEKTREEAEETRMQVDELRRETAATHMSMGEAVKQLEIVRRAVAKARTAERRAVEDMRLLTDNKESSTHNEPDKKIRISLKEYEDLRGKQEESERMVRFKAKTVDAQVVEISESTRQWEKMLEEKMKEIDELEKATDGALRNAEIAEEAHCIVDDELRKWRPQEL